MKYLTGLINLVLLCLYFCCISCSEMQVKNGWDEADQIFRDQKNNLQWDLSSFGQWSVAEESRLTSNISFCAALNDDLVCVTIIEFPIESNNTDIDIWEGGNSFMRGFIDKTLEQSSVFPGLTSGYTNYENCYFLMKKAIRFGQVIQLQDARLGTDEPIDVLYGGYAFTKGKTAHIITALMPLAYVMEENANPMEDLFRKFSYINASKEK